MEAILWTRKGQQISYLISLQIKFQQIKSSLDLQILLSQVLQLL